MKIGVIIVAAVLLTTPAAPRTAVQPVTTQRLEQETQRLAQAKLRQEIRKLELENRNASGIRGFLSNNATLLTGGAAILTALVALFNIARQRRLDRQQRELDSARRVDERFTSILTDLGAESESLQAGAAGSLLSFLRPELRAYHRQVRLVVLANLKVPKHDAVAKLLVRVLEAALRTQEPLEPAEIDFSDAALAGIDLSGLDLRQANLTRATLTRANLQAANLFGVKGHDVDLERALLSGTGTDLREARFQGAKAAGAVFHDANLTAAKFYGARLTRARFESARLQSAHFERARLEGARFHEANINDTFFIDATLDDVACRSLLAATNTSKAHFDPPIQAQLHRLGAQSEKPPPP